MRNKRREWVHLGLNVLLMGILVAGLLNGLIAIFNLV